MGARVSAPAALISERLRRRPAAVPAPYGVAPHPPGTAAATREWAPRSGEPSGERVFAELRRIVLAARAPEGLGLASDLGVLAAVLPELESLRGLEQSHFHHLDVYDHTIEVLGSLN